jgi:FAD:protein FMN transferase
MRATNRRQESMTTREGIRRMAAHPLSVAGAGLSLLLLSAPGCSRTAPPAASQPPASETWSVMNTYAAVSVPDWDKERLAGYAGAARDVFEDLQKKLNFYDPQSELSRLNEAAGTTNRIALSPQTLDLLNVALGYAELTRGSFDPTVGPLMRLWGFGKEQNPAKAPEPDAIRATLKAVGYRHVVVSNDTVFLDTPGARVDLGGIAKGYAVDAAYRKILALGATNTMVNLGGSSIRCLGLARTGKEWTVGVRNPFDHGTLLGTLRLTGGMALSSSGNYERFVTIGDRRYSHIMDPRTGYPVEGVAAVTVICPTAVEAEAMSKAVFVMGIEEAAAVLAQRQDCHALLIPDSQPVRILMTPGLAASFTSEAGLAEAVTVIGK